MKPVILLSLAILLVYCEILSVTGKKVKSSSEDKSDESKSKEKDSGEVGIKGKGHGKPKDKLPPPPVTRNLTFMISARNLGKLPERVDPYVSMFYETKASDLNALSSEVVAGNINPDWTQVFWFPWTKGTKQQIRFKVKNQIKKQSDLLIGEVTLDVDEYVKSGEIIDLHLKGNSRAKLSIEKTTPISFRLSAKSLARKDTFNSKSDAYVKCFWRHGPDGADVKFAKTSVINNVEDADWADIITFDAYQPGKDQYWSFKVFDDDGFTSDDFLGEAFVKIDQFLLDGKVKTKTVNLSLKGTLTIKMV